MYDKETQKELKKTTKLFDDTLESIFKSKTFKCSIYLLKYIYDKDEKYFDKFSEMFNSFSIEDKMQVLCNVRANLIEQGKIKDKNNELIKK